MFIGFHFCASSVLEIPALGISCSLLLDESKGTPEEKHAKTLPAFFHFGCGKRNEMDLHDELVGLGHLLPTWQHSERLTCTLPVGQR